ncbi:MAG: hypothetical protein ACOY0T_14970 [Myxococcota bacterium]
MVGEPFAPNTFDEGELGHACERIRAKLPANAEPTNPAKLRDCDSEALYYGIGVPKDLERARACALAEFGRRQEHLVFGGASILMMIYANGDGLPANFELAARYACDFGGAPAELASRLAHLDRMRASYEPERLDVCDHATSGLLSGFCAKHEARIADVARADRKRKAVVSLPPKELERFERAAKAFIETRVNNEVDLSGTLRAAFQIEEEQKLADAQVELLEKLPDPAFPRADGDKSTEAELKRLYESAVKNLPQKTDMDLPGQIAAAGVKKTQRIWLQYREAWIALGIKVRPDKPREVWSDVLTRARIAMLKELAD